MHDHTYNKHKIDEFTPRDASLYPINNYMRQMKECGKMDFGVVSDHGNLLTAADFFRGYADAEDSGDSVIYFPGCEGQVTVIEPDRYGIDHMHGGEVLIFNADLAFTIRSWNDFFKNLKHSPFAFCGFPHPQAVGGSVPGIWNFDLEKNNSERFRNLFRFVEMGDGSNRSCNMVHYYTYSVALDNGFHVSPTCASDSHGSKGGWGYKRFPGKTVIMAPEKSKEAFLDAILNNRMYATSTGNVKLYYEVNGKAAPTTLNNEGEYSFHVDIAYFRMGEEDTRIKRCRVISDEGKTVLELKNMGDVFDFTISKPDAHWFYLQLLDEKGRYTWSCPVWTGLPYEKKKKEKELIPVDKKGITCIDEQSGTDAALVINDDPTTPWRSEGTTASLLFDLSREEKITAFSIYPKFLTWTELKENNPLGLKRDELPPGRQVIDTFAVKENMRERIYAFIRKHVLEGRQAYVVCPMVEEGELPENVKSAQQHAKLLQEKIFPDLRIGLLHGKMKSKDKDAVMSAFVAGNIDVLVSTTVVEVGVDVPNSVLMVVENAERFGLSQLHQLRGRVGRGKHKSYCILFDSEGTSASSERLKVMCETNDGFKISEADLKLRGPGDFFGS
ncbi:MAG: hypothetical protein IKT50_05360, partial [Clostridia bacterium]|nr:hypothetical protein [Clostridia bacterium]